MKLAVARTLDIYSAIQILIVVCAVVFFVSIHTQCTQLWFVVYTDARCLGVSRQKQLAKCTPLTRIEKQRAPNGDKTPGTEQLKFAQRHPLLLSDRFWQGQPFVLIPQLG